MRVLQRPLVWVSTVLIRHETYVCDLQDGGLLGDLVGLALLEGNRTSKDLHLEGDRCSTADAVVVLVISGNIKVLSMERLLVLASADHVGLTSLAVASPELLALLAPATKGMITQSMVMRDINTVLIKGTINNIMLDR